MAITNKQIWVELKTLGVLLRGPEDDREDMGLLGDVKDNTQFRRSWTRFLWVLVPLIICTWGTMLFALITGGSQ